MPQEPISPPSPGQAGPTPQTEARGAAWTPELLDDPHAKADKADRVRSMFAAIAPSYDLNNHLHALGIDHLWRRAAVKAAGVRPGDRVVDLACGTGDLTQAFAKHSPAMSVIGIDFTPEMLDHARVKQGRLDSRQAERIEYRQGDAMDLDLETGSAQVVSMAFGLRNVQEPQRALNECLRVLAPGGRLVILEFDQPRFGPVRWFNRLYCETIMPRTATMISGDRSGAYRYLPKSVASFKTRDEVLAMIGRAGGVDSTVRGLSLGLCACYRSTKAPE